MFTGFATENTPAIQIRDYFRGPISGTSRIGLTDDCAPIQLFRTGAVSTAIVVYLPTCPVEGKIIKIVNQRWAGNSQSLSIVSSDQNLTTSIYSLGQGGSIDFIYSKHLSSQGTTSGAYIGGWTTLNFSGGNSSSINSVALGSVSAASGTNAFAVGNGASSTSTSTVAIGDGASASGVFASVFSGTGNSSSGTASTVVGGYFGTARSIAGNVIFTASVAPISSTSGTQQTGLLVLGRQTTDATATRLTSDSNAGSTINQLILPNNSAYVFQGTVIANRTGGGDTSGWKFEGTIKRGANAASTTLVAAVTPTVISQDAGAAAWVLAVTADTTNGGLAVTVTGAAATTIRWVCRLESTEVTF